MNDSAILLEFQKAEKLSYYVRILKKIRLIVYSDCGKQSKGGTDPKLVGVLSNN
jgi:hypothetical protein